MEPKLNFTLPSLHDNTILNCRIYYCLNNHKTAHPYAARGAIIAHPYAPLGGCYDDPVVGIIVKELLNSQYGFVCTFNFRGVYGGSGHTSWTGKAERADYESVTAFMIEFLRRCDPSLESRDDDEEDIAPPAVQLILGGYSYGSWICTHLPDPSETLKSLEGANEGSAGADIKARAQHLATQTNMEILAALAKSRSKHVHTLSVGGEQTSPTKGGRSDDALPNRFSTDIRKSLEFAKRLGSVRRKRLEATEAEPAHAADTASDANSPEMENNMSVVYLLVSPLLPPISTFAALPFGSNALQGGSEVTLKRLSTNPTLAIFADNDAFTSVKKLRAWAQDLSLRASSEFHHVEIDGAGHFWRDTQSQQSLAAAIGHWLHSLLQDEKFER